MKLRPAIGNSSQTFKKMKEASWKIDPADKNILICGIDEAGRGPVIGPMVIAGVAIKGGHSDKLTGLGVNDSKKLSPRTRGRLYPEILSVIENYSIKIIEPAEIDAAVLGEHTSINTLESRYFIDIIRELKPAKLYLDSPGKAEYFQKYINALNDTGTRIIAENKADTRYPAVAAASILAKVTRDNLIEGLRAKYGDMGTGYPSPKTNRRRDSRPPPADQNAAI